MTESLLNGIIIRAQSGFFTVETEQGPIVCQLRGRFKKNRRTGDIAAVGDHVRISAQSDGSGMIEEIEDRHRAIIRLDPRPQGLYRQILLANPDQAVFVFACAKPKPKLPAWRQLRGSIKEYRRLRLQSEHAHGCRYF